MTYLRHHICILLFILNFFGFSQSYNQDSIKTDINHLLKTKAPSLAKKYTDLGLYFLNKGELDSTEYYCKKAIVWVNSFDIDKGEVLQIGLSNAYRGLSEVERMRGNISLSKEFAVKAVESAQELLGESRYELGISHHLLALYYYDRGTYDSSLYHDLKAFEIVKQLKDTNSTINYLGSIAIYYDLLDQSYIAEEKLEEAKAMADVYKDVDSKVHVNISLSKRDNYKNKKKELLLGSLPYFDQLQDPYLKIKLLNYVGKYYSDKNKLDSAIHYLKKATSISSDFNDLISLAQIRVDMVNIYLKNRDFRAAFFLIEEIEKVAKTNDNKNLLRTAYTSYVHYYKTKNEWKFAYEWNEKLNQLNNDLQNEKIKQEAFDKELEYQLKIEKIEYDKREILNQKEKQNQKVIIFFLILLFLIISTAAILLLKRYRSIKEKNKLIAQQNLEIQERTKEAISTQEENHRLKLNQKQQDLENSIANNKLMIDMKSSIIKKLEAFEDHENLLKGLILDLKQQLAIEGKLGLIEANSELVNTDFYRKLAEKGKLSKTELEVCSYIRLNLSTKEIAELRGSTDASVRVSRSRIREKLGLNKQDNLHNYIKSI